jgi:dienelactone hydrolase
MAARCCAARALGGSVTTLTVTLLTFVATTSIAGEKLGTPTGPWAVGTRTLDWIDESRGEPATVDEADHRQLVIQMWYPIDAVAGEPAPYMPRLGAYRATTDEAFIQRLAGVRTNSTLDAPMSATDALYPVVLFSHGWSGSRSWYSVILEHIASYGYVVVGIDHPYLGEIALPDGSVTVPDDSAFKTTRDASDWYAADIVFAIDMLVEVKNAQAWALRMDTSRIATTGHSSGGSAAVAAAAIDSRIGSCASFDAGVERTAAENGVTVPVMLFRAETGSYTAVGERPDGAHEKGTIYPAAFFSDRTKPFYEVVIAGTTHGSFGDYMTVFGETETVRTRELEKRREVVRYLVAFLDMHLKGSDSALLSEDHDGANTRLILHTAPDE